MGKEIYNSETIRWYVSRVDKNGKIDTIAVPFVINNSNNKLKNILNGKVYDTEDYYDHDAKIKDDLNAEYGRNLFKAGGTISSVIVAIKSTSIINYFVMGGDVDEYKNYYSKNGILRLTKLYERALNKFEKIDKKEEERRVKASETREF